MKIPDLQVGGTGWREERGEILISNELSGDAEAFSPRPYFA